MSRSLGIPVKLLHEAAGHIVSVELKSGELYRGSMIECEDNWNCQLENITFTAKVCGRRISVSDLYRPLFSFRIVSFLFLGFSRFCGSLFQGFRSLSPIFARSYFYVGPFSFLFSF